MHDNFEHSIVSNIQNIDHDFFDIFHKYQLVGIGETPHRVNEYYTILLQILEKLLKMNQTVLLLLEKGWWLSSAFENYIQGNNNDFLDILANDVR